MNRRGFLGLLAIGAPAAAILPAAVAASPTLTITAPGMMQNGIAERVAWASASSADILADVQQMIATINRSGQI